MRTLTNLALAIVLFTGCSSLALNTPPELRMRTLRISKQVPGFEYQYRECTRKILGLCRRWEVRVEYYDLSDEKTRSKLINMGFVARVKEPVLP